ncbi:MAG TPA: hypothetical protein VGS01_02460 [Candidatus Limnocylindria bacterium]|nr:hypothetical protein [Candidatus Limnocylindria bacterium]
MTVPTTRGWLRGLASWRGVFATVVCVIAIGSFAADLVFLELFDPPGLVFAALPLLPFAVVGSLLVVRRAGGPIGWLLGAAGAFLQLMLLMQAYGYASLYTGAALRGGELALWLGSVSGSALVVPVVAAMVLFPDGRPPSRTFAILMWVGVAAGVTVTVTSALADQPILVPLPYTGLHVGDAPRSIPNPFALHGPVGDLLLLAASVIYNVVPLMLVAPLALVVRFRRSRGTERAQLKWLTYTAAISFGLFVAKFVISQGPIRVLAETTSLFALGLLPVAIAIAVTRYRLYDIDVLINRTLVYGALSAVLVAAYVTGVAAFQFLLSPLTAGSPIAVAASTLGVVALFQPLRRRIQTVVDRRFYRQRYDAERTLDLFSDRLRDHIDIDMLERELVAIARDTMRPTHASVWLRERAP